MLRSVTTAGTPAGQDIAKDNPGPKTDGDRLIGVIMHHLIGRFGSIHRLFSNPPVSFLAVIKGRGEPLASLLDFLSGDIGGGGHQGACVFG